MAKLAKISRYTVYACTSSKVGSFGGYMLGSSRLGFPGKHEKKVINETCAISSDLI